LVGSGANNGDSIGWALAMSGDVAIAGAWCDDSKATDAGAAYIYKYNTSSNDWGQVAKLTASDGVANDFFGRAVSISGNTAVVGCPWDDSQTGSAYVYQYIQTSNSWVQTAKLTASDYALYDRFGNAVSVLGNTIFVGSPRDDAYRGAVYVFQLNVVSNTWQQVSKLTASDGANNDMFGISLSVSENTLLIGAYGDDGGRGSAYVFKYNNVSNVWSQVAKLTASDYGAITWFGWSVAVSGGTAVIGAYYQGPSGDQNGSAYVFQFSETSNSWGQVAKLTAADGAAGYWFGYSVAVFGNNIVVGAHKSTYGQAYVFQYSNNDGWHQVTKLTNPAGQLVGDNFGFAVAVSQSTILIGTPVIGPGSVKVFSAA
jgi:hypothetical protein